MTSESLKFATFGNLIRNYIVPGMDSVRIEKVRMFHAKRQQEQFITPHSHRFDLSCYVLDGEACNTIYEITQGHYAEDQYGMSTLKYLGVPGTYDLGTPKLGCYRKVTKIYERGQWYSMTHDQIHSIEFAKGSRVLIFEGPEKTNVTNILQPCDDYGDVAPTFKVEDWMFKE